MQRYWVIQEYTTKEQAQHDSWSEQHWSSPCNAVLCWIPPNTHHPPKYCCRPSTHSNDSGTPQWHFPPQQDKASSKISKTAEEWPKKHDKMQVSNCPRPQSHRVSIGTRRVHGGRTSQSKELKGTTTYALVPHSPTHSQGSCVHAWVLQSQVQSTLLLPWTQNVSTYSQWFSIRLISGNMRHLAVCLVTWTISEKVLLCGRTHCPECQDPRYAGRQSCSSTRKMPPIRHQFDTI